MGKQIAEQFGYKRAKHRNIGTIKIKIGRYIDRRLFGTANEEVGIIFESSAMYDVCTRDRGILGSPAYLFGKDEVIKVEGE